MALEISVQKWRKILFQVLSICTNRFGRTFSILTGNRASMRISFFISRFPLCDKTSRRHIVLFLWTFLLLLPFHEYYLNKFNFPQWDLLLFSGVATLILGLKLVGYLPIRFYTTVDRLFARGSLKLQEEKKTFFLRRLETHARNWARAGGILVAFAMLGAFCIALSQHFFWKRLLLCFGETIGAYIAGTYLGRMASYGQLGWQLKKESVEVLVQPFHVDGVAGLKPIGDFFFYQAMISAIPAIFLAVWWFLFPIWPRVYSDWDNAYLALLSIAIMIEILVFLVPLWAFHRIMVHAKANWMEEADRLSIEISELRLRMETNPLDESKKMMSEEITEKSHYYWAIENMPTWPITSEKKRRFKVNNLLLFIPLLWDFAKRTIKWEELFEIIKKLN